METFEIGTVFYRIRWLLLGLCVVISAQRVAAGPPPLPREAQLDLASDVVVGQIIQTTPIQENRGPGSHCGRVTVQVQETLKGKSAKTLQFLGVTALDPGWMGARIIQQCRLGEKGIWLIQNGWVADNDGLLSEGEKPKVKKILQELNGRNWSQPVNGLRAWSKVVQPGHTANPVIIFAVNNAFPTDLFVPNELDPGFVSAIVTDHQNKITHVALRPEQTAAKVVSCYKLPPGQTMYLHPDYSYIDVTRGHKLTPGTYSVAVQCQNSVREGGSAGDRPGSTQRVTAWTGELRAAAVELVIPDDATQ